MKKTKSKKNKSYKKYILIIVSLIIISILVCICINIKPKSTYDEEEIFEETHKKQEKTIIKDENGNDIEVTSNVKDDFELENVRLDPKSNTKLLGTITNYTQDDYNKLYLEIKIKTNKKIISKYISIDGLKTLENKAIEIILPEEVEKKDIEKFKYKVKKISKKEYKEKKKLEK